MHLQLDTKGVQARVHRALAQAGPSPQLLGYDVLGIQEYVTANGRPKALRGASHLITQFDQDQAARPECIFAGGGRGTLLLPSADQATQLETRLKGDFARRTISGRLATAQVPLDSKQEAQSLNWLQHRLDLAKEASPAPIADLPTSRTTYCQDCGIWATSQTVYRGEEKVRVCSTCHCQLSAGGRGDASVNDLATRGYVALVSADGNNMGKLFGSLETMLELAIVSEAISELFGCAHQAACRAVEDHAQTRRKTALKGKQGSVGEEETPAYVSPVAGGDDLRILLSPLELESYLETLVSALEAGRRTLQKQLAGAIREVVLDQLAQVGVGIGVVIADSRFPIARLFSLAHDLEVSAKRICRPRTVGQDHYRGASFALDYRYLIQPSFELQGAAETGPWARPLDLRPLGESFSLRQRLEAAQTLSAIPRHQLGVLSQRDQLIKEEFFNLFKYQVARSKAWQTWFLDRQANWCDAAQLEAFCPDNALLELVRLVDLQGPASREAT